MGGESRNAQRNYSREAKDPPMTSYLVNSNPYGTHTTPPISFTQEDAIGVYYPYYEALVVRAIVARNGLSRMLVDNGSSVNILFGATYDKMQITHSLTLMTAPLYDFIGDNIVPRERITLAVEMGAPPLTAYHLMEFLVVDHWLAYHGVLGRPH